MFTKEDLANYRALKLMLGSAQFNLKGIEVLKGAALLQWFEALEPKIIEELLPKKEIKNAK